MSPNHPDPELQRLLQEWKLHPPPHTPYAQLVPQPVPWWRATVAVPVPVLLALALVLASASAWMLRPARPVSAPPATVTLQGFQPVANPSVRILRGSYANQ